MAEASVVFDTARSLCEEAGQAAGIGWMDYQVKLQNTFLHVVQPMQGSHRQRASSAPASPKRSESQEVAVGRGGAEPAKIGEMQSCASPGSSAAQGGASAMEPEDHEEDALVGFDYDETWTVCETPTASEADAASFWSALPDSLTPWGMASRESTPVKQLELIELRSGSPRSVSTGWAGDADQSDGIRGEASFGMESTQASFGMESTQASFGMESTQASFGMESTQVGNSIFADIEYTGPINSTKDFEMLRPVPKCSLSSSRYPEQSINSTKDFEMLRPVPNNFRPSRLPTGAPYGASGTASNHGGKKFIDTGYFGSRDSANSRVMAPARPATSRLTSGHLSPPLGAVPVSSQTQPYSGKRADTQDEATAEVLSSGWSVGTALHSIGKCRPCTFAWKEGGCTQGTTCKFCHVWHAAKRVQRPCKNKRVHYRKLLEKMAAELDGDGGAAGAQQAELGRAQ